MFGERKIFLSFLIILIVSADANSAKVAKEEPSKSKAKNEEATKSNDKLTPKQVTENICQYAELCNYLSKSIKTAETLNESELWNRSDEEIQKLCDLKESRVCRPRNYKLEFVDYYKERRSIEKSRNKRCCDAPKENDIVFLNNHTISEHSSLKNENNQKNIDLSREGNHKVDKSGNVLVSNIYEKEEAVHQSSVENNGKKKMPAPSNFSGKNDFASNVVIGGSNEVFKNRLVSEINESPPKQQGLVHDNQNSRLLQEILSTLQDILLQQSKQQILPIIILNRLDSLLGLQQKLIYLLIRYLSTGNRNTDAIRNVSIEDNHVRNEVNELIVRVAYEVLERILYTRLRQNRGRTSILTRKSYREVIVNGLKECLFQNTAIKCRTVKSSIPKNFIHTILELALYAIHLNNKHIDCE